MHLYGIAPEKTPFWKLLVLQQAAPVLYAEQMKRDALVMRAGQANKQGFKGFIHELEKITRVRKEAVIPWIKPEAVAWFEENNLPYQVLDAPALEAE